MSDRQGSEPSFAIGVVGAVQYDSSLLLELLRDRPDVQLIDAIAPSGVSFAQLDASNPERLAADVAALDLNALGDRCDILCLALPNGFALSLVPQALDRGCRVVDLSADFRLRDFDTYRTWYRTGQTRASLPPPERTLGDRRLAYGLPELFRSDIAAANAIAGPGSVATASLLGLAPLLRQGLIDTERIAIDLKSSFPSTASLPNAPTISGETPPAGICLETIAQHPQIPEIEQVCSDIAGRTVQVHLSTYTAPIPRGLLASIYTPLRDPGLVNEDLLTIYKAFYKQSPWVDVSSLSRTFGTAAAVGTNVAAVGLGLDVRTNYLAVLVAIDDRLRGRAGQAVQCLNLMMGQSEKEGLPQTVVST